jgi:hypothetical protein
LIYNKGIAKSVPQEILDFPLVFNEEHLDILRNEGLLDPSLISGISFANKKEKRA